VLSRFPETDPFWLDPALLRRLQPKACKIDAQTLAPYSQDRKMAILAAIPKVAITEGVYRSYRW
jgi:hypothetical protein